MFTALSEKENNDKNTLQNKKKLYTKTTNYFTRNQLIKDIQSNHPKQTIINVA